MNCLATVLMCTYNASKYIYEQLDSIYNQTYKNIELIIYDDKSTDDTASIIESFMSQHPDFKVTFKVNQQNSGGAKYNFRNISQDYKDKEYVLYSDQDDIWSKEKVQSMMERMARIEQDKSKPYMVCHNSYIVDSNRTKIGEKIIDNVQFNHLVLNPAIQGCCMLVNGAALRLADFTENKYISMHDWYLSLVCSAIGEISIIDKFLLEYRQHENNVIGYSRSGSIERLTKLINVDNKIEIFKDILLQLDSVSENISNDFFTKFRECKNAKQIIKLFNDNQIFTTGIKGLYQKIFIKKAFNCIR